MNPLEETQEFFALHPIFQQDQHRTQSNQQHHPTKNVLISQCEIINSNLVS
jgi:hypothetical protein